MTTLLFYQAQEKTQSLEAAAESSKAETESVEKVGEKMLEDNSRIAQK